MRRGDLLFVLIGQGAFDTITPYFRNKLLLEELAHASNRISFSVFAGHSFYYRDRARRAFRQDALEFYGRLRPI